MSLVKFRKSPFENLIKLDFLDFNVNNPLSVYLILIVFHIKIYIPYS